MKKRVAGSVLLCLLICMRAVGSDVIRHSYGTNVSIPIARATEVPEGFQLIFHSGVGPTAVRPEVKEGVQRWGDTRTQTVSTLRQLETSLESLGLSLGDVVKLTVYLVGDPATGRMDFDGFMAGYRQFFGTKEQPNLPSRATVQVAGLHSPGMLIEIDATLARKRH